MSIFKKLAAGGTEGGEPGFARRSGSALFSEGMSAYAETDPPAPATTRSMWDAVAEDMDAAAPAGEPPAPMAERAAPPPAAEAPAHEPARAPRRRPRITTRLMGFDRSNGSIDDFTRRSNAESARELVFPVGWLVIVEGPGRGHAIAVGPGVSTIGRGEGQAVTLDYGDIAISRDGHAMIAFDEETRAFYLGHGSKPNPVSVNGQAIAGTVRVSSGDRIGLGETALMLVALCGPGFSWAADS